MRSVRRIGSVALIAIVPLLGNLAAPAVAAGPSGSACAMSGQLYRIDKISNCDRKCPSYDPVSGCWCYQLPPIIVKG